MQPVGLLAEVGGVDVLSGDHYAEVVQQLGLLVVRLRELQLTKVVEREARSTTTAGTTVENVSNSENRCDNLVEVRGPLDVLERGAELAQVLHGYLELDIELVMLDDARNRATEVWDTVKEDGKPVSLGQRVDVTVESRWCVGELKILKDLLEDFTDLVELARGISPLFADGLDHGVRDELDRVPLLLHRVQLLLERLEEDVEFLLNRRWAALPELLKELVGTTVVDWLRRDHCANVDLLKEERLHLSRDELKQLNNGLLCHLEFLVLRTNSLEFLPELAYFVAFLLLLRPLLDKLLFKSSD